MDLYEQKYNDALERAETLIEKLESAHIKGFIYHIFPELIEDEDERTRKEILNVFKQLDEGTTICGRNYDYAKWIAWLKKQGEQPTDKIEPNPAWSEEDEGMLKWLCRIIHSQRVGKVITLKEESELGEWMDKWLNHNPQTKQGEQSADNFEPKLHEGDWIISNNKKSIYQVIEVKRGIYVIRDNVDNHVYHIGIEECEKSGRLWSINDAKDGDVLMTTKTINCPFIYRKTDYNNNLAYYYAGVSANGDFCEGCLKKTMYHFGSVADITPATKEQRDLLFQKMKNAGYEWNAEKKELKKMEVASKEGDDERIRKAIHIYLDWLDGRENYQPKGVYTIRDMIDWVIKQDKKISADKVIEWLNHHELSRDDVVTSVIPDDSPTSVPHRVKWLSDEFIKQFKKDFGL